MTSILISSANYAKEGEVAWQDVASQLLVKADDRRVWCFHGDLGSGKTTCIQALCSVLGVKEPVRSPTFGLVHEYVYEEELIIYHFDFYRLSHRQEALDIGIEEYLDSGSYCFIEWPEVIKSFLPVHYVDLHFTMPSQGGRKIDIMLR